MDATFKGGECRYITERQFANLRRVMCTQGRPTSWGFKDPIHRGAPGGRLRGFRHEVDLGGGPGAARVLWRACPMHGRLQKLHMRGVWRAARATILVCLRVRERVLL